MPWYVNPSVDTELPIGSRVTGTYDGYYQLYPDNLWYKHSSNGQVDTEMLFGNIKVISKGRDWESLYQPAPFNKPPFAREVLRYGNDVKVADS